MTPKRIVIVDDDVELCEEMAEILSDEGFSVDTAHDSEKGLTLINQNNYNVIILDFKIPGLNGLEVIRELKTNNVRAAVFLVSGRPFIEKLLEEERVMDFVAGFLNKPFDIEALVQKIKNL